MKSIICFLACLCCIALNAQELVIQMGHSGKIFSIDSYGSFLVTGSQDQTVKIWNVKTNKLIRTLSGHVGWVNTVSFSNKGSVVVSGSEDGSVIFWDVKSGQKLKSFTGFNAVRAIAVHDSLKKIAIADASGKIFIRSLEDSLQKGIEIDTKSPGVIQLLFSKDAKKVVSSENFQLDKVNTKSPIVVWDAESGLKKYSIDFSTWLTFSIALTGDDKELIGGSYQGHVFVWDFATGKEIVQKKYLVVGKIQGISYHEASKRLYVGTGDPKDTANKFNSINAFSYPDLEYKRLVKIPNQTIRVVCINSSGTFLSVAAGASIVQFDVSSQNKIKYLDGFTSPVHSVNISPDSRFLSAGSGDNSLRVFDLKLGKLHQNYRGHTSGVISTSFSPDQNYVASGSFDEKLKLWDFHSGKLIHSFEGYDTSKFFRSKSKKDVEWVNAVSFSSNSKFLFTGSGSAVMSGRDLKIWDINGGKLLSQTACPFPIYSLDVRGQYLITGDGDEGAFYSPMGKMYLTHTRRSGSLSEDKPGKIRIYDLAEGGKFVQGISDSLGGTVRSLAFNKDGNMFAGAGIDGRFNVWYYSPDGNFVSNYPSVQAHKAPIWSVDLSYGRVATGSADNTIRVFYALGGNIKSELKGHQSDVLSVRYLNNKFLLASGSADSQIKFWNSEKGTELLTLVNLKNSDEYIVYTPEGYYMSTKNAGKAIGFRFGERVVGFEQLDLKFNRPDKVLQKFNEMYKMLNPNDSVHYSPQLLDIYKTAYEKRVKRAGFDLAVVEKMKYDEAPEINMQMVGATNEFSGFQKVKIDCKDAKSKLVKLHVWVNGVPLYTSTGLDLRSKNISEFTTELEITLTKGENVIEASVFNEFGVESIREVINAEFKTSTRGNLYLITLNVGSFKDEKMNLKYAAKDGSDLIAAFQSKSSYYANVYVHNLSDSKATLKNIEKLEKVLSTTRENDVVIFFISSHGVLDQNLDYYIATHDIDFTNPSKSGLSYYKLESLMDIIKSRNKILLIDACHSGEIDKEEYSKPQNVASEEGEVVFRSFNTQGSNIGATPKPKQVGLPNSFELMKSLFSEANKGTGATVISAAGGAEYAMEGDQWKNGVFTYTILSGLKEKKADSNGDGKITISELQQYVQIKVPLLTNGKQQPTSRSENANNNFVIWE